MKKTRNMFRRLIGWFQLLIFDPVAPEIFLCNRAKFDAIAWYCINFVLADAIALDAIALLHRFAMTDVRVRYCISHPLSLVSK